MINDEYEGDQEYKEDANSHPESDSWLSYQLWTLFLGVVCGLMANVVSRLWAMGNNASSNRAIRELSQHFSVNNKMAIVVRTDLGMGKGKMAAQCSHATLGCYRRALKETPKLVQQWERFGQTKVVLKVDSEGGLYELQSAADAKGLVSYLVRDAGRTQIESGSMTVLGIGPAPSQLVDDITGSLKLL